MNQETVDIATNVVSVGAKTGAPEFLVVIGGIIAAAAGIAWPIIQVIRKFSSDKIAAVHRNEAEITLYAQLKEQLENNKKHLDEALRENISLWKTIGDLEARLKKLELLEADFEKTREKLNEKDAIIFQRNAEIAELSQQLKIKEYKIKDLETRVAHLESLLEQRGMSMGP
jgi:predicted RNase H-like nuclease (RuvC/YqgF family)